MKKAIIGGLVAVLVVGCVASTAAPADDATAAPTSRPVPTDVPRATPAGPTLAPVATDPPAPDTGVFRAGDPVTVTHDDEEWATIIIDHVKQVGKYDGEYIDDTPEIKGNVFIEMRVTYEALADGVDYNPFDWQMFVGGRAVDDYTFVSNGPEPALNSGNLPKGRVAQGYLVYEVPPTGEVLMSYGGIFSNDAPLFEVVLRD